MKKIIIEQPWGGLGDNLQFSTIPEVAYNKGIDVYISNRNVYRNEDIKRLVWDLNPYIKGYTDEPGNIGEYIDFDPSFNIIMNWERKIFGDNINDSPKLYYKSNLIDEFLDKTIIDANAISRPIDFTKIIEDNKGAILINGTRPNYNTILTKSIFEWVDIILSAKKVICQYSGPSVVLPCYDKGADVYMNHYDKTYKFKQNKYINL
jgi:hypothetical protein